MRIAQVAPLWEPVPPRGYGGIELVVALLTDGLVEQGHDVTLFASGDSHTKAKLETVVPNALRLDPNGADVTVSEMMQTTHLLEIADQFDLIHCHTWIPPFPLVKYIKPPIVYTLHGNFTPQNEALYRQHKDLNLISISDSQRHPLTDLNYVATVYNGINTNHYSFYPESNTDEPYLAFLGRMSPQKGPHLAIEIARRSGWKLIMAGKVDKVDVDFFEKEVKPHIDGEQIVFLGEVNHTQKMDLMGNAAVTLFPITWQEPFGLVMVESMATGTPVLGMNLGAVPEVIKNDVAGFVCDSVDEMLVKLPAALELDRQVCRDYVVSRFGVKRMVDDYVKAYEKVWSVKASSNGHRHSAMVNA
ncbi:glycosyltransferase family 4 protein [Leptothoe sp. PORK10 BA2]|uniref:glycosyltransferase family 4 protein n=1 Tax=Leptothoe sp. PORK10 BA2 TaxID=3110254 RepID=UPI002B1F4A2B|nr:glycosyltransferase family 4 protein [Leptothoe sp. PORK10 BA2]MEA5466279.1 glycosyltransferase family 4 protein [Leptothoe sp. PORK10 BA2]